jgi:hypothetical protein
MPVQFETLPSYVRMVLDDHVHNNPSSDLLDLLTGRKSFQEALESPQKTELKRMTATRR